MTRKKIILTVVLAVAAIAGGMYLYSRKQMSAQASAITLYGNVDVRDVSLGFRVSGRIVEMRFEEGDRVKRETVVAVLDKRPFLDNLALAKAELDEANAAATYALRTYERAAKLVKSSTVSQSSYDDARAKRDEAKARKLRAEAQVASIATQLDDTELRTPSDGTILTRVREPGAIVAEGATVYSLALNSPVWVRTYIDEPNLGRIYPGQKARILTDSGNAYDGRLGFISPQAEFTPKNVETTQLRTDLVYRLRLIVDNADNGLRQGMPVTVKIRPRQDGDKDGG